MRLTKMKIFIIIILLVIASLLIVALKFNNQSKYHSGGPYYYKSWASYFKPFKPVGEISINEALKLEKDGNSYYEAYFNKDGLIVKFIKHNKSEVIFEEEYVYKNGKLINTVTKERGN